MFYGNHIRLRAVEREDLPRFVEWFNDPEVRHGLMVYLPMSQAEEERWYEHMLERPPLERPFAVDARADDAWAHIGGCSLMDTDARSRRAELGIVIGNKAYWDRGFGTDVMRTLLRYGFETLNLHRIYLRVFETNPRAIKVYQRVGFTEEGRLRESHYLQGRYVDTLMMSVLREEWNVMRGSA